jgi:hypothetical protein
MRAALIVSLVLFVSAARATAIVTRHDLPEARYVAHAANLPSYCRMNAPDGGGALIAQDWVITAAHLAPEFRPGHRFTCGDELLIVEAVVIHPAYRENIGRHDLALVKLARPSRQQPSALASTPVSAGTILNLIGHWQGGTGLRGVDPAAAKLLKGATNRVATANERWIEVLFDRPDSPASTALEGVSGGGDSGAPAYSIDGGRTSIVGVGSRNRDLNENGVEQDYGDSDRYVPVAHYRGWIDRVVEGRDTAFHRLLTGYSEAVPRVLAAIAGLIALVAGLAFMKRHRRARP